MLNDILWPDHIQWQRPTDQTLYRTRPFTEFWVVSIEYLRRVWHADRGRLLLRTPGPVPLGLAYILLLETSPLPNLSLFYRTMLFEFPSVLSRFCLLSFGHRYFIFQKNSSYFLHALRVYCAESMLNISCNTWRLVITTKVWLPDMHTQTDGRNDRQTSDMVISVCRYTPQATQKESIIKIANITQTLRIISVRCIPLSLRSNTQRRATLLPPTWIYSCQSEGTVSFALPFTTSVMISINFQITNFPFLSSNIQSSQPMAFLSHNYPIRKGLLLSWIFYSEGGATFQ